MTPERAKALNLPCPQRENGPTGLHQVGAVYRSAVSWWTVCALCHHKSEMVAHGVKPEGFA